MHAEVHWWMGVVENLKVKRADRNRSDKNISRWKLLRSNEHLSTIRHYITIHRLDDRDLRRRKNMKTCPVSSELKVKGVHTNRQTNTQTDSLTWKWIINQKGAFYVMYYWQPRPVKETHCVWDVWFEVSPEIELVMITTCAATTTTTTMVVVSAHQDQNMWRAGLLGSQGQR